MIAQHPLAQLVQEAQAILAAYRAPTGPSKADTITALSGLLDGERAREALAGPVVQASVPEGHKVVPIEPTLEMLVAGQRSGINSAWTYDGCYRAMLAAAPEATSEQFNAEKFGYMLYRLSLANRRDGWTTNDPWKDREACKRASDAVNAAEKEVMDYVRGLLATPTESAAEVEATERKPLTDAARDVLDERERQINAEGWTTGHDDSHSTGAMARAASVYALVGSSDGRHPGDELTPSIGERLWPWDWSWFKPNGRRRNLVKAGALLLAEIERMDRAIEQHHGITGGAK